MLTPPLCACMSRLCVCLCECFAIFLLMIAFSSKLEINLMGQLCRSSPISNSLQDESGDDTCIQTHRGTDAQVSERDLVLSSGKQPVRTAISPTRSGATRYSSFFSLLIATISPAHPTCHSILLHKRGENYMPGGSCTRALLLSAELIHSVMHKV